MAVKVGCCGFPVKRTEYYRRFPLVEIQQTFYLFNNLFMGQDALRLQRLLGQAEEDAEAPARSWRGGAGGRETPPEPGGTAT